MSWWGVGISAASLIVGAIGTGVQYSAQQQQASNAEAVANYNAQIAKQNNQINLAVAQQQTEWQQRQAQIAAQTAQNNATTIERQADANQRIALEQASRTRAENQKQLKMQRARYAKSGVTSEGSPLAVMAETASLLELGVQDQLYQSDMEDKALRREAANARIQGDWSKWDEQVALYEGAAAEAGASIAINKSRADYLSGMSTAAGYKSAAFGTLLSGAGDAISSGAKIYDRSLTTKLYKEAV